MTEALTIRLARPVAGLRVVEAPGHEAPAHGPSTQMERETERPSAASAGPPEPSEAVKQQTATLVQLVQTVNTLATRLNDLHQQTIAHHRGDIARLAVEIARKILAPRIENGEYDIQTIVEEVLKRAPARQNLVVRLNPEDLAACQRFQQENPDSQFAELDLVADWSIARADCLVETPKGIVKSFVEEHLARIGEALERAQ
ncbi:FliH/SctL family protein [Anaerobaca lacustris]|uniref:Flagellar assembly protein FliH n=1 Tax=Anaerobaca lacustris TaxID=3044600 RepID=A0AAW6TXH4_9BACT|nr:FliH/SctL family protein [Sedimentisphaerales bacterium M17dextr]